MKESKEAAQQTRSRRRVPNFCAKACSDRVTEGADDFDITKAKGMYIRRPWEREAISEEYRGGWEVCSSAACMHAHAYLGPLHLKTGHVN